MTPSSFWALGCFTSSAHLRPNCVFSVCQEVVWKRRRGRCEYARPQTQFPRDAKVRREVFVLFVCLLVG